MPFSTSILQVIYPEFAWKSSERGDGIVRSQEIPWSAILGQQKLEALQVEITPERFQQPFQMKRE